MDIFSMVLSLLSGVALFLFGMSLMGDGLKMVAGNKLESFLYKMTNTSIKGVALGAGVTSVIQSSSATTVMVIGFVNSGMMKLKQAIGIIMGANIGTSITGWILCLSYIEGSSGIAKILSTATISAVVAIVGILFKMASKRTVYRNVGNIMLGFSILMVGMQTMSGAVAPLKENPAFTDMLTMFSNPIAGILLGIAFTAVLQSASASVGILQALSVTGSLTFATAFPIVLGIGVGAACPVLISAIGANKNGKRTALVYLLNDLFGMIIWGTVFYSVNAIVHFTFLNVTMTPVMIAIMNTVFRVLTVCVLFPFIPKIEKLVKTLVKDTEEDLDDNADFDLLEERLLAYPALAIGQCNRVMDGMARKVRKNVGRALNLINEFTTEQYNKVQSKENLIDKYETKLGEYLMQLTKREMNTMQTRQVSVYLHIISDLERVGDYASNIARVTNMIHEGNIEFSEEALKEINVVMDAVRETTNLTVEAYQKQDRRTALKVKPLALLVTVLCEELKLRHVTRLSHGECGLEQGTVFNDLLNSMDRIAAHCSSVAIAVVKQEGMDSDMHIQSSAARDFRNGEYRHMFAEYLAKYDIGDLSDRAKSMEPESMRE